MVTFGDLKVGDHFFYVNDTNVTVYKVGEIADHGSYLTISGVGVDDTTPDRGFNISKDSLGTTMKHRIHDQEYIDAYFSDWREVKIVLSDIIYEYESVINDIKNTLSQLAFPVYRK